MVLWFGTSESIGDAAIVIIIILAIEMCLEVWLWLVCIRGESGLTPGLNFQRSSNGQNKIGCRNN